MLPHACYKRTVSETALNDGNETRRKFIYLIKQSQQVVRVATKRRRAYRAVGCSLRGLIPRGKTRNDRTSLNGKHYGVKEKREEKGGVLRGTDKTDSTGRVSFSSSGLTPLMRASPWWIDNDRFRAIVEKNRGDVVTVSARENDYDRRKKCRPTWWHLHRYIPTRLYIIAIPIHPASVPAR